MKFHYPKKIDIVIATYNGGHYIQEQLSSIIDNELFRVIVDSIIISDDGSKDNTLTLAKDFLTKNNVKYLITHNKSVKGPVVNFSSGLQESKSSYIMLCDQDDVWDHDKIKKSVRAIYEIERNGKNGAVIPTAVVTDSRIVDADLNVLYNSLFQLYSVHEQKYDNPDYCLLYNNFQGCTMIINRSLLQVALPISPNAIMHDWWLSSTAAAIGNFFILDVATMSYRQHQLNAIGVQKTNKRVKKLFNLISSYINFRRKSLNQILLLSERIYYERRESSNKSRLVDLFILNRGRKFKKKDFFLFIKTLFQLEKGPLRKILVIFIAISFLSKHHH